MITIVPVNEDMTRRVSSLKILNEFMKNGFTERKSFVRVCMDECPELNNYSGMNRLNNFWAGRDFSINNQLEEVLEILKNS